MNVPWFQTLVSFALLQGLRYSFVEATGVQSECAYRSSAGHSRLAHLLELHRLYGERCNLAHKRCV